MVRAIVLIAAKPSEVKAVPKRLRRLKGVKRAYSTLGRWDGVVITEDMSLEELGELAMKAAGTNGVRAAETLVGF